MVHGACELRVVLEDNIADVEFDETFGHRPAGHAGADDGDLLAGHGSSACNVLLASAYTRRN